MHVDDFEALKKWLTPKIEKLCEANPFALAKYISALIRKDKPEDELHAFCVTQLADFFNKYTDSFVDKLFLIIKNKSYLNPSTHNDDVSDIAESEFEPDVTTNGTASNGPMIAEKLAAVLSNSNFNSATDLCAAVLGIKAARTISPGFETFPLHLPSTSRSSPYSDAPPYVPTSTKSTKNCALSSPSTSSAAIHNGFKQERCTDYDNRYVPEPYNPESPGMNMDSERKSYNDYKRSHGHHLSGLSASSAENAVNYETSFPPYKPQRARELIGVSMSNNSPAGKSNEMLEKSLENDKKRKIFDTLGGPKKVSKVSFNKCVLEVRKIPVHLNKMEFLINHFKKFGAVVHIQIEYDDDPEAALVQYSEEEEARAAYRSSEPVLNNRFIKVFFQRLKESRAQPSKTSLVKESNSAYYTGASSSKPFYKPPTRGSYKYERNIQKENPLNKRWQFYLKKLDLFKGQMSNQKLLMSKLESCKKPAERVALKKLMFELTEKIQALQEELKVDCRELKGHFGTGNNAGTSKSTLTNEIESNKTQEAKRAEEVLRAEVDKLEAKAKSLGILDNAEMSLGSHEGPSSVKETALSNGSCSLSTDKSPDPDCHPKSLNPDSRSKSLLLSGLTDKIDQENLKKHFQEFGVVKNIDDALVDNIIITFSSVEEAEKAFSMGKNFGNITLNLNFHHELSIPSTSSGIRDLDGNVPKAEDDDDDEDDEEESEARSWRH